MKVFHVCNTAGVASIIAKYMDRLFGTESLVVCRKVFDPYGLTTYGEVWDCGANEFALKCLLLARKFDIIHVHSFDKLVPLLKFLYPKKPVILHYHGTDIRGKWALKKRYWSKAEAILYSTKDLLNDETPKDAIYMPNPVDTEIFYSCAIKPQPKTAFHFSYGADDLAREYSKKYGLKLTIHDVRKHGVIPHLRLPKVLCIFEYYVDVKRVGQETASAMSKTGLEALACGLKVIRWDGSVIIGLPLENRPENISKKIFDLYLQIRRPKK